MGQNFIRLLKASEIECRIAAVRANGLSLLLYKDARVDQKILDETYTCLGWQRSHQCINGDLYCTVEIFDKESGEWIAKQDVGTTGNTEKEKSQASDSFKRACFNWGIGRELYSAPFIWVPAGRASIQSRDGKYYCHEHFSVKSIAYNEDREIAALVIENDSGKPVYEWKAKGAAGDSKETGDAKAVPEEQKENMISKKQMASLQAELDRTGVTMQAVQSRYRIQEPDAMNEELYHKVMAALSKTKSVKVA